MFFEPFQACLSTNRLQTWHIIHLNGFTDGARYLHVAQTDLLAKFIEQVHFFLSNQLVGKHNADHVFQHTLTHTRIDAQDILHRVGKDFTDISLSDFIQELAREHLHGSQRFDDTFNFIFIDTFIYIGYNQAG